MKFQIGQRVILPANPDEDIPEERGVLDDIDESNGMCIVTVDEKYHCADWPDDGMREVYISDMKPE